MTVPDEPANETMLIGLDPTPGYEGVVCGLWYRRDDAPWADADHRWYSTYTHRTPTTAYTWSEAFTRGAQPDMPLVRAKPARKFAWATTDPDFPDEIWETDEEQRARSHAEKYPHVKLLRSYIGQWEEVTDGPAL